MNNKIALFVSHADKDVPVVKSFVNLIESGIGVPPQLIFCSCNKGQGIRPGAEFKDSIREQLDGATIVTALISENYYNSPFCMCELGGTWIQAKDFIPILIPPIRYSDMKAVLAGLQAINIQTSEDLDELRDEITERLGIKPLATPRWNEKRDDFLIDLPEKLNQIPHSPVVQRDQFAKVEIELKDYKHELSAVQAENLELKKKVAKLKKAKDAKQVAQIERESLDEITVFSELLEDIKEKLDNLEDVTVETFFADKQGEYYYPGQESSRYHWDEARRALEYQEVTTVYEDRGLTLNGDHPHVKDALSSFSELENWLADASSEFYEWYTNEHNGFEPNLSDRTFWDNHIW